MGSWGTGLHSNDTASDVRDACNEVYPLVGAEKGTEIIFREFREIIDSDIIDNDYASFWYSLADWQWKHGILTDDVKTKAIELLKDHTGIDEWEEDGSASDVRKRIAVMDELLIRLESPMPPVNIKKARMKKPKHKIGDIVIIRTGGSSDEYGEEAWSFHEFADTYIYKPHIACRVQKEFDMPYRAFGKYVALLCVGIIKEPHSQYVEGYFDEYSVYAFYDYISDEKPSVEILKSCGFLPAFVRYCVINSPKTECCCWDYMTTLCICSFKVSKYSEYSFVEKQTSAGEAERFHALLSNKGYSKEYIFGFGFYEAFESFFKEKIRLDRAGIAYDNLLDENVENPPISTPEEMDEYIKEETKQWLLELGLDDE